MSAEAPVPEGSWSDFKSLHFKLYYYKVLPCTKPFSHDWQHCPFTHPNDKARRRSPLQCPYVAEMCPTMLQRGACPKGVNCHMAHNLFEYHLHPDRYKTKMCRDGVKCNRVFCFFAHTPDELRVPFLATTAGTAAAGQQQAGGNSSSSSTSASTPVNQPATPSSSLGNGRVLDAVAQKFATALDSGSLGGSSTTSVEMNVGARSCSGMIGTIRPAGRDVVDMPDASLIQQIHDSSSMRCHILRSSNSCSRLRQMQQDNGAVACTGQQQQQPCAFLGSACDAAANQQLQTCYSVWNNLPTGDMHNAAAAGTLGHMLRVPGSNTVFDTQTLVPLGVTRQVTDAITSLAMPAASSTSPWAVQAATSPAMNFITSCAVNSGVKYGVQAAINMDMTFADSMTDAHAVTASTFSGAHLLRRMYPSGAAATAAEAGATTAASGAVGQQQPQQQPLQFFLQSGSSTPMLTQQLGSTAGQCNTVLLPGTLLTATTAAGGGGAVQRTAVPLTALLNMPGQQQQTLVSRIVEASSTAPAGATVLPMSQWLV